jgi:thioredoxin reductase (NADPH)
LVTDYLLAFFGLESNLSEIENWHIELETKHLNTHIKVDPATMKTSLNRVFAIGDACTYPGKLKLILTGFAESAIACHNSYNLVFADKKLHFEHSTNKGLNTI